MGRNLSGFVNPLRSQTVSTSVHPLLIGLTGKFGAGKSTASNYIVERHHATVLPFAQNLKMEVYDVLADAISTKPLIDLYVAGAWFVNLPRPKLIDPTPLEKVEWVNANKSALRWLLQFFGQNKRSYNANYWVDKTVAAIKQALADGKKSIVVDDVRYHNEAQALAALGFTIVRIAIDKDIRLERVTARDGTVNEETLNHPSETEQDLIAVDYHVENSGSIDKMQTKLDSIILECLNPCS